MGVLLRGVRGAANQRLQKGDEMSRKTAMPAVDLFFAKCEEARAIGSSAVYVGEEFLEKTREEWLEATKNGETSFNPLSKSEVDAVNMMGSYPSDPSRIAFCCEVFSYLDPSLVDGIEIRPIA